MLHSRYGKGLFLYVTLVVSLLAVATKFKLCKFVLERLYSQSKHCSTATRLYAMTMCMLSILRCVSLYAVARV